MKKFANTRPKVSEVTEWKLCFDELREHDWRNRPNGSLQVYSADNFYDYYKIVTESEGEKKTKYFFGERAWSEAQNYCWDFGVYIQF